MGVTRPHSEHAQSIANEPPPPLALALLAAKQTHLELVHSMQMYCCSECGVEDAISRNNLCLFSCIIYYGYVSFYSADIRPLCPHCAPFV